MFLNLKPAEELRSKRHGIGATFVGSEVSVVQQEF